jgi:hypothetical protein
MERQLLLEYVEKANHSLRRKGENLRITLCNHPDTECNQIIVQEPANDKWKLHMRFCPQHIPLPQKMTCQSTNHNKADSREYMGMQYSRECKICHKRKIPLSKKMLVENNES